MYHISKDLRTRKSADKILQALTECLKTKSLSQISFTDLSRRSGVGRSTIYRLFDTCADILQYGCDCYAKEMYDSLKKRWTGKMLSQNEFAEFVFDGWTILVFDLSHILANLAEKGNFVNLYGITNGGSAYDEAHREIQIGT